jgi:hypothetical protein
MGEQIMERINRNEQYPQPDEAGDIAVWTLPLAYGELEIEAQFLGVASSQQDGHSHPGEIVTDNRKCARCRWFEPRIFRETDGERRYILYTVGCSDVPGEKDLIRYRYARDGYEAVANMKTPHPVTGVRAIVGVTKRLFEQAASFDSELKTALEADGVLPAEGDTRTWRTS